MSLTGHCPEIRQQFIHRHHVGIPRVKITQMHRMKRRIHIADRLGRDQCPIIVLHRINGRRADADAGSTAGKHNRIDPEGL